MVIHEVPYICELCAIPYTGDVVMTTVLSILILSVLGWCAYLLRATVTRTIWSTKETLPASEGDTKP